MRYFLDQDLDGDWYVVPDSISRAWNAFKSDMAEYRRSPQDFVCEPFKPEEVERVDGPHTVLFGEYAVEPF